MKKLFLILAVCVALLMPGVVSASNTGYSYTVTLDTYAVTGDTSTWPSGSWPNIAGGGRVDKIIVTNASSTTIQTVTFYDTATTTTTLTTKMTVVANGVQDGGTIQLDYPFHNTFKFSSGLVIKKSSASSVVTVTVIYR